MKPDIIFISSHEENAEENWEHLQNRFPEAIRVHGVIGIRNAHEKAAAASRTDFFFTIDGDNQLLDNFTPCLPNNPCHESVYVWRCLNPVNKLVYGNGGVKLWHKSSFIKEHQSFCDHTMTATTHYRVVNILASVTNFNTSPLTTWRSAFREAVKLKLNIIKNNCPYSIERLKAWQTIGEQYNYGNWSRKGAIEGEAAVSEYDEISLASIINDYDKLETIFNDTFCGSK